MSDSRSATVGRAKGRGNGRPNRDQHVIEAAISVMSERGYAATSVQEVADRVGVLKGSLYHYFASKEDLLFRILDESHAHNRVIAEEVAALGLCPLDELCEYARRLAQWYLGNVERANIYFSEARHLTGDRRTRMIASEREFEKHIGDLVERGRERGEIDPDTDARILVHFVMTSLNDVRTWRSRPTRALGNDAVAASFTMLLRRAIAR